MADKAYNVLFLCTGNSARSIMAESIMNQVGGGRFKAYSAGSHPTGKVNPYALDVLKQSRMPVYELRCKAWDEFAAPGAPQLDFIFTVCDNAAGEVCPVWPGKPISAHWGVEDPAAVEGPDKAKRRAFTTAFNQLRNRITMFASLPLDKLDAMTIKQQLAHIGKA